MSTSKPDTRLPIVFLVEDCPTTGLIIERTILHQMPGVRLIWACSVAEAITRSTGLPIDLFLVDVCLPDGSGLDFLWRMAVEHPMAKAIVMSASPLPEYQAHSAALGVLHFLGKPVRPGPLVEYVRAELGAASEAEDESDFKACLKNVTPADIIQLKCLTRADTIVEIVSGEFVGRIRFEDGEIANASVGAVSGVKALDEILGWKRGQVRELPTVGFCERDIHQSWQNLLMEAAQRLDEQRLVAV